MPTLDQIKEMTPMERLLYWISERESIRLKKENNVKRPWTTDPILQSYRFCNVHREHDKVTIWIKENWREPNKHSEFVWFAMVIARLINWPDTLQEIGYPVPWNRNQFVGRMLDRQQRKEKLFTGAYMIHADAHHGGTKAEYLADCVLDPLWTDRKKIGSKILLEGTLEDTFQVLRGYRDMGEFMVGQVIADVKYTRLLDKAPDWWTWATPGPGSRRGMSRLLGKPLDFKWKVVDWQEELKKLRWELDKHLAPKKLHAQDVQSCLCEFDKYERVLWGQGKLRSKYPGV